MRVAMIGTRGVPAAYGGFETAVEEIGSRLVDRGHQVTVYCRGERRSAERQWKGMDLVHLPAVRTKAAETLSHTALSVGHAVLRRRPDMAFVFNAANAPFLPLLHARGIPTAVHVDGLEWKRDKWGGTGRRFYRWAEEFAVRWGDALISDATGISDYYRAEFALRTEVISYGAPLIASSASDRLAEFDLRPGEYHLVVARFEPENHVDVIVQGYRASNAQHPLVVVGSAPYAAAYTRQVTESAGSDGRIRFLGPVFDQAALDQLYRHAISYLHGHSVGGTNPSLLRAMGAGTAVIAWDVIFNREVAGNHARYFGTAEELASAVEELDQWPLQAARNGRALQDRAAVNYNWEHVTDDYETLAARVIDGYSTSGPTHPRTKNSAWSAAQPAVAGALFGQPVVPLPRTRRA